MMAYTDKSNPISTPKIQSLHCTRETYRFNLSDRGDKPQKNPSRKAAQGEDVVCPMVRRGRFRLYGMWPSPVSCNGNWTVGGAT